MIPQAPAVFKRSISNISLLGWMKDEISHNFIDYLQLNIQQFNNLIDIWV